MNTMTKVKSYLRQFEATIKGDDAAKQAEIGLRQSDGAIEFQISGLKYALIKAERVVTEKEEAERKALINNGKLFDDEEVYCSNLVDADNATNNAKKEVEKIKKQIEFFTKKQKQLQEEVEVQD